MTVLAAPEVGVARFDAVSHVPMFNLIGVAALRQILTVVDDLGFQVDNETLTLFHVQISFDDRHLRHSIQQGHFRLMKRLCKNLAHHGQRLISS